MLVNREYKNNTMGEPKSWFFVKMNKINKPLACLTRKKEGGTNN